MRLFLLLSIIIYSLTTFGAANSSKDPFKPLATKWSGLRDRSLLRQYDLSQLKVIGVVYETKEPRALIQDPSGLTHIATLKNMVGKLDGTIVKINKSSIIIKESVARLEGGEETRFITMTLTR